MLTKHTAYNLFSVSATKGDLQLISHAADDPSGSQNRKLIQIQRKTCKTLTHLRFCPLCARQDTVLYGEAYWHLHHQLDGIRFCPTHKVQLHNSDIEISKIAHHFFPASLALRTLAETTDPLSEEEFGMFREEYLHLGRDVCWLMKHGTVFGSLNILIAKYRQIFSIHNLFYGSNTDRIWGKLLREKLYELVKQDFFLQIFPPRFRNDLWSGTFDRIEYFRQFTPTQHALLMGLMYGSPLGFYHAQYCTENDICLLESNGVPEFCSQIYTNY